MKRASGSFGSRNGQPWSRSLATANDRAKPSDIGAGTYGALAAPSQESIKRAIEAQVCPWCGAGPYKMLAGHTNKAHGVDRAEIRSLAGVAAGESICSPERSSDARQLLTTRTDFEEISRRGLQAANKAGAWQKASAQRVENLKRERADMYAAMVIEYEGGALIADIAARHSVPKTTVRRALDAAGHAEDGRARYHRMTPRTEAQLEAMNQGKEARLRQARDEVVARFHALGGGWEALIVMAGESGRSRKGMRETLLAAGVELPDGRAATPFKRKAGDIPSSPKKPCSNAGCDRDSICKGLCTKHYQRLKKQRKVGA